MPTLVCHHLRRSSESGTLAALGPVLPATLTWLPDSLPTCLDSVILHLASRNLTTLSLGPHLISHPLLQYVLFCLGLHRLFLGFGLRFGSCYPDGFV